MSLIIFPRYHTYRTPIPAGWLISKSHPIARGLLLYHPLIEGGGTKTVERAETFGAHELDGTLGASVAWTGDQQNLFFNGTQTAAGEVTAPGNASLATFFNSVFSGTASATFAVLAKIPSAGTTNTSLVEYGVSAGIRRIDIFVRAVDGLLFGELHDGVNYSPVNAAADYRDNKVHLFVFTIQPTGAGGLTLFVDNAQVTNLATYTAVGNFVATDAWSYGNSNALLNRGMTGNIYSVWVWNRALPLGEIVQMWENPWRLLAPQPTKKFILPFLVIAKPFRNVPLSTMPRYPF